MFLIILHHAAIRANVRYEFYGLRLIGFSAGKIGVCIFVLISGYYLCRGKFKPAKLFALLFQMSLFSFVLAVVFYAFTDFEIPFWHLFLYLFPYLFYEILGMWWFMIAYVLLYVCSPLLNIVINNITRKVHFYITTVGFLILIFVPYVLACFQYFQSSIIYSQFVLFVYLYFLAAYFRCYDVKWTKNILFVWFGAIFLLGSSAILGADEFPAPARDNDLFVVLTALFLLLAFRTIKFKSKIINFLASGCLSVYLVHEFSGFKKYLLWQVWFVQDGSIWFMFWSCGVIFAACLAVGLIYNLTTKSCVQFIKKRCIIKT